MACLSSEENKNPYGRIDFRVHLQLFFSLTLLLLLLKIQKTASIEKSAPTRAVSGCGDHHLLTVKRKEKKRKKKLPQGIIFSECALFSMAAR